MRKKVISLERCIVIASLTVGISILVVYTLLAFTTKLLSSDIAAGDWFGDAVAIDGTTAVIAAYKDDTSNTITDTGSAYVFAYDGTIWNEEAKLIPSDGAGQDQFGFSADIDANTIIVGSLQHDAGGTNSGAAYVYVKSGNAWSQEQKLVASDAAGGDYFGYSAAISGNTIVIGAFYDDNSNGTNAGAVYVFTRSGTTWTQQQKIIATDGAASDEFGNSVDIDGETIIIGARYNAGHGAAYIYTRSGAMWSLQQKLIPSDGAFGDTFGLSTALESNRVAISAPQDDDGHTDTGSLYIFERNGVSWTEKAKIVASDGELGDRLGLFTMGISGNYVAAAAPWSNDNGSNSGATYLFKLVNGSWTEQEKIVGNDVTADDWYGIASDIDGDWILMGAERSSSVYADGGSVYAYSISANNGPTPTPTPTPTNSPPGLSTLLLPTGNIETTLPTYTWSEIANADYYQILVYNVDAGTTEFNIYRYNTDYTCNGTNCSETLNQPLTVGTSYKWYMQAWNANGASGWTSGKSYTIIGNPPTVALSAPLNGSSFAEGSTVTLTGTASDPEDGDLTSSIAWSSDLDGSLGNGGTVNTASLSIGTHLVTAQVTDSNSTTAIDSITITITGQVPGPVTQLTPLNNISSTSPSFEWRPESTATGYIIAVYDVTNDNVLFYNDTSAYAISICSGNNPNTDICSVQPSIPFVVGDNYVWVVRALNTYGNGPWSNY